MMQFCKKKAKWLSIDTGKDILLLEVVKIKTACFSRQQNKNNGNLIVEMTDKIIEYQALEIQVGIEIVNSVLKALND